MRDALRNDQRGADTVRSAAETLWPHPAAARLRRGRKSASGAAPDAVYAIVPTVRSPRYLVPAARGAAVALRPAQRGVKGLRMLLLSHLQGHSVLQRLPGRHLHVTSVVPGENIEGLLSAMVGDVASVVVRLGRPRPNRTLVVWAIGADGAPLGIAKVSRGDEARKAMETEYAALARSPAAGIRGLVAPSVLAYATWRDNDVLAITALSRPSARPSHQPPVPQMRALAASAGAGEVALRETAFVARLSRQIAELALETDRSWLRRSLDTLVRELGDTQVCTGAWHGDWVSWNQSCDHEGVLLWDWEHYATSALAGFDHVHFLAQERRARGTDAAAEEAWLVEAGAALTEAWGMRAEQTRAVLRAYLLEINLRFVRDRQHEEDAPARAGWSRRLVERLEVSSAL